MVRTRHTTRRASVSALGPAFPRRWAHRLIFLFLAVQTILFLRAALPLPERLHGPWPWRMFERRGPWERQLVADGVTPSGERYPLPLDHIFGYARGTTRLHAYHQVDALDPASDKLAERAAFAEFLGRRMSDLGITLTTLELRWIATHVDSGVTETHPIGTFPLTPRQ